MDNLFRQTRLRFSGVEQEEPKTKKTVSFKERRNDQNWVQRRLSPQMSRDRDMEEQAIAVAAAAYAISSLPDQTKAKDVSKTSTVTIKSKKEDTAILIPELAGRLSRKASGEFAKELDRKVPTETNKLDKASSSYEEQYGGSFKPGNGALKPEMPRSSTSIVSNAPQVTETKRHSTTRAGVGKSQADIWEETELAKITQRYEEQKMTILSWEDKNKTKAKRRLNKDEREVESKRARAIERFRKSIQSIDHVVGGAKAKAAERKKSDELKAKEKARTIRRTGKVPTTCFGF